VPGSFFHKGANERFSSFQAMATFLPTLDDVGVVSGVQDVADSLRRLSATNRDPVASLVIRGEYTHFWGSATPCESPPHRPSIFSNYSFWVHYPVNRMSGIPLHMQWPLVVNTYIH
jgi:hypothetical protein